MRRPTRKELEVLQALFDRAEISFDPDSIRVENMEDGEMGSLKLSSGHADMKFGRMASEIQLEDLDGVPVLFSLYLNKEGRPYEMDAWKSDYSPTRFLHEDS